MKNENRETISYGLKIRELPEGERPRERMLKYGPSVLQTSELLAIVLRSGTRKFGAQDLARHLVRMFGSLKGLSQASIEELCAIDGVGPVKAMEIQAAFELGRRMAGARDEERQQITGPEDAAEILAHRIGDRNREHFMALLMDTKHRVIKVEEISIGSLNGSVVHPRECFKPAVQASAAAVIFAHNHPSGDVQPSKEDKEITTRLREAGEIMGIKVLDHLILGDGAFYSIKEEGSMNL
ncbi:DNA repair protein RadC [Candidatus Hydrogenedentota bacterium]